MSTSAWLEDYNDELNAKVMALFGSGDSSYYEQETLDKLAGFGVTGFYFNSVDAGTDNAPDWLPAGHRLATQILTGRVTRSATSITADLYEKALDGTAQGGKMHTILYYKDVVVDFQSLVNLGNLNKHVAMGTQVILGSPTTGFLKAVTTFVSRFAGRNDIVQMDKGTWDDGLEEVRKLLVKEQ